MIYLVDQNGNYLGGFSDPLPATAPEPSDANGNAIDPTTGKLIFIVDPTDPRGLRLVPRPAALASPGVPSPAAPLIAAGAVVVPNAPDDARQVWSGKAWGPAPAPVADPVASYLVALGNKAGVAPPASLVAQANPVAVNGTVTPAPAVPGS